MKITDRTQTRPPKPPEQERPQRTPPPPPKTEKAEAPKPKHVGNNVDVQA